MPAANAAMQLYSRLACDPDFLVRSGATAEVAHKAWRDLAEVVKDCTVEAGLLRRHENLEG